MDILQGIPDRLVYAETTLTIGVFDGVHRGHQALIGTALHRARAAGRLCIVLTFDPHPVEVLAPSAKIRYLTTIGQRARLIESAGVDALCIIPFTHETAGTSARDFVRALMDRLRMRDLVIGYDFTLGHKRQGDAAYLTTLGGEWGYSLMVVEPTRIDGEVISSTVIRRLLSEGRIDAATELLGHHHAVDAVLQDDYSMHPAANLLLPRPGIYAGSIGSVAQRGEAVRTIFSVGDQDIHVRRGEVRPALIGQACMLDFARRVGDEPAAAQSEGQPLPYQEVGHTADVALRVTAKSMEDLFRRAAEGMFAFMVDLTAVEAITWREVIVGGADAETLLVNWLSELLYLSETTGRFYRQFEVRIAGDHRLHGFAIGGPGGQARKQIKAVTFHGLSIHHQDGLFDATIVFDV